MTKTADNIYFYVNNLLFNTVFGHHAEMKAEFCTQRKRIKQKNETDKERLPLYEISDKRLQHPLEGRQRTQQCEPDDVSCFTF